MQRSSTLIKLPFLELADWGSTCDMLAREFDKVPIPTHSAYKKYKSYTLYYTTITTIIYYTYLI